MKNVDIDISIINSAIDNAGNEFTIAQIMKSIGNKSAAFSNRLARIASKPTPSMPITAP